uniref:Transmembrane protein n=1 Tax=Steinernema glaseri TaxID=37863 RepID=A0A1I8AG42_9BILA
MSSPLPFFSIFDWDEWVCLIAVFGVSVAMVASGSYLGVRHEDKRSRMYKKKWATVKADPTEDTVVVSLTDTSHAPLLDAAPSIYSPIRRKAARALSMLSRGPEDSE